MPMLVCQQCNTPLNQTGDIEFIIKCRNCAMYNKYRYESLEEGVKLVKDNFGNTILYKKQFGNGVLYTYRFDLRNADNLRRKSNKSGEALEKFVLYDTGKLSLQEKNILYKLKSQSISEIDQKIQYLVSKKRCIEILKLLDF